MSNRVATVLSIVAGMLLTAACLGFAAYEFNAPQWQVAIKGEYKGWDFGKVAGIRSDVKGMPAFSELKSEWKWSQSLKYGKVMPAGTTGAQTGNGGPGQIVIFRSVDRSSPKLAQLCAQGGQLGDITLQSGRVADKDQGPALNYLLHDVTIASITLHGPNSAGRMNDGGITAGQPYEEVALSYGKIDWTFAPTGALKMFPK